MEIIIIACIILAAIAVVAAVKIKNLIKKDGICPICLLNQLTKKSKLTIEIPKDDFYSSGCAQTPPMGWSSWNTFSRNIDEELILDTARAMVKTGLAEAGYTYINIDDCWHASYRSETGELVADPVRFKSGIESLARSVNELGLKLGIYSSNGEYTCEDLPGSQGHEKTDARTFAKWGIEYFKYDFCHNKKLPSVAPLIEKLEFVVNGERIVLNADSARLSGKARLNEDKELSTGKYISMLGHGSGRAVFTFNCERECDAHLVVHVRKYGMYDKYLIVKIGARYYDLSVPPTHGWAASGRYNLEVKLDEGENTVELFNPVCTRADSAYVLYKKMGEALKEAAPDKKITYSICEWGKNSPVNWAWSAGNLWRTTYDIRPNWQWINVIYNINLKLSDAAGPGHWNDPDMLEVGNGKLTYEQNKTHFSLWCMMAAPLILGNDLRELENNEDKRQILEILMKRELIEIDRDSLGEQCRRYKKTRKLDYLIKRLSGNRVAICVYNKSKSRVTARVDLSEIGKDYTFKNEFTEAWSGQTYASDSFELSLEGYSCAVLTSRS